LLTAGQRRVFASQGYRRLWAATAISELASNLGRMAFILLVHELARASGENPERDVAIVVLLETLPMLLLGPVAGALVDRFDRRRLLVGCDVLSLALMATIPWLATLDTRAPLFAVAMVFSAIGTVFHPARQSAIPDLVPPADLGDANGISTTTSSLNLILGMSLAGAGIEIFGKNGTFLADAAVFGVSAVLMLGLALPRRRRRPRRASELLREAARGLDYLRRRPVLVFLTLVHLLTYAFIGAWIPLLPAFAETHLGVDPDRGAPALFAAFGVGGILGGIAGPSWGRRLGRGRVVLAALVGAAAGMIAFALVPSFAGSLATIACGGALIFAVMVQDATIVQQAVPPRMRGRVFAARHPMQALGYLVATCTIIALADRYAPAELMLGAATTYAGAVLLAMAALPGAHALARRGWRS